MEVEIKNIVKNFKDIRVLNNINLKTYSGDTLLIVGKNGAGKTTLLRLLLGLYKADSGTITVNNVNVLDKKYNEIKKEIGFLNDNIGIFRDLTAWDNIEFFHRMYFPNANKETRESDISNVLKKVDLYPHRNSKTDFFSRGMKQRLVIARAIVNKPKLLILDEPHRGLDVEGKEMIKEVLGDFHKSGSTIIINSHDLNDVQESITHLAFLYNSEIVCQGSYKDLINKFNESRYKLVVDKPQVIKDLLSKQAFVKSVSSMNNELIIELNGNVEQLSKWLYSQSIPIHELVKMNDNLTTLYKKIIS
ncbi:ABC transporter [Anaerocolumna cellulosilytica]|uniref:ABC transporter n=1 Tax=Anaerocolumna cellulosilytica TaxID=433286 RepID=A0A6S6QXX7_9FIRM|nr:ABC transporter ATP-binding protein [Anaerocolumna cellulosilytica]MBB5196873.1 ABC-type multidrug transport system ATPase subunit [Anaerocolumna cellulosilytica]BCJ92727.1 ABC transporter [Anaerocolumna cellulosilytica]